MSYYSPYIDAPAEGYYGYPYIYGRKHIRSRRALQKANAINSNALLYQNGGVRMRRRLRKFPGYLPGNQAICGGGYGGQPPVQVQVFSDGQPGIGYGYGYGDYGYGGGLMSVFFSYPKVGLVLFGIAGLALFIGYIRIKRWFHTYKL